MSSGILALLNSSIPCRIKFAFSPNISPPPSVDGRSGISDGRPLSAPDPRGSSKPPAGTVPRNGREGHEGIEGSWLGGGGAPPARGPRPPPGGAGGAEP